MFIVLGMYNSDDRIECRDDIDEFWCDIAIIYLGILLAVGLALIWIAVGLIYSQHLIESKNILVSFLDFSTMICTTYTIKIKFSYLLLK